MFATIFILAFDEGEKLIHVQVGGARERTNDDSVHTASPAWDRRLNREGTGYSFRPWESTNRTLLLLPGCWCRLQGKLTSYTLSLYLLMSTSFVFFCLFIWVWDGALCRGLWKTVRWRSASQRTRNGDRRLVTCETPTESLSALVATLNEYQSKSGSRGQTDVGVSRVHVPLLKNLKQIWLNVLSLVNST